MEFTYEAYKNLLVKIRHAGYEFSNYRNWNEKKSPIILRHDIDYDISKAVKLAELENIGGVQSTYFVLMTSDFYNIFSKESCDGLKRILYVGHEIGLHFDEVRYPGCERNTDTVRQHIKEEAEILEKVIERKVDVVSMHRPSKSLLEANLEIPGIINSYDQTFFREFKYLSDSRRRWREPVDEVIESKHYEKIHLLTHAFWYNDEEHDLHDSVYEFVNGGNQCRYEWLLSNITDLGSIMSREEIV